ncbi:hypothetical protein [Luteolibacter luteus]|uniref:Toxin co-regulated pilus biosynthesis protein Q C-terminal domain-containing protein n=1 Tax=Luteolibacter luteus TaxID=2728835 RepID=A0A858RF55_9BACT|nr:hypothetical protein [Luteolibacter luteus]QJE95372.1 hypothetical protein HHL09_06120 [Luteolibacter luteus]
MKLLSFPIPARSIATAAALAFLPTPSASALSLNRESPEIHFPANYDIKRKESISSVIASEKFRYLGGLTSFWEPEWSTTLVYEGDVKSLNEFLAGLWRVEGLHVRVTFSSDLSAETGSALKAGSWWLVYSHTMPDTVTVRLNLAAETFKGDTLELLLPKP